MHKIAKERRCRGAPRLQAGLRIRPSSASKPTLSRGRSEVEQTASNSSYMARPPISSERIRLRDDGKVTFYLKRARKNGVNALVYEGVALVARLAALIPPPGMNMRVFYGLFAARHPLRSRIVPVPPDPKETGVPTAPPRPARMSWADLMKRVFAVDVLKCQHCDARMRIIKKIDCPTVDELVLAAFVISGQVAAALKAEKEARAPPRFRWPSRTQESQNPKDTAAQ